MLKQTTTPRIWLSSPHMGDNELNYINQAFDMNWVAPIGPQLDEFENRLKSYVGINGALALSSGTSAIHLALLILGVGRGDEVICQSLTFVASANPIVYIGAQPIFVDSEKETWNMCPVLLRAAIEDRISKGKLPKAIIMVHLYGMPAKIDEIVEISKEYNIPIIEDSAESLGSTFLGQSTGTFGDFGVFSFNGNKIITTSGGGALLSNRLKCLEKAKFLATQARDPFPHYEHTQTGYNYRMSNISAAIGLGQMEVLNERVSQRRSVFDFYKKHFIGIKGITFVQEPAGAFSNRWLTTILLDSKQLGVTTENIRLNLEKENIESRPVWKPMQLQPLFKECPFYGDGYSETFFNNGLCLPSGSNLRIEDLERVVDNIARTLKFEYTVA